MPQPDLTGGHVHGTVTSLVLLPQIVDAVSIPVVGSGGLGSGRSLVAGQVTAIDSAATVTRRIVDEAEAVIDGFARSAGPAGDSDPIT
ncbi:hypothetical protein NZK35_25795 [Stieleria sp. ICT_E10.1]|uniref:hypothetical protein n=1 Tax=Stieleria sedimenti TaxID=2976331 RepID=UPI00217F75D0|nr:hypothetical protein [Stieleria sedimenti]MCS7470072.1 hypothetical protein [Stieleria sedimenti]